MSDFFALLNFPRTLVIDSTDVDEVWRNLTKEIHPDGKTTQEGESERGTATAELNEARRVLSDPFFRLEHWLTLRSPGFSKSIAISPDLMEMFSAVNDLLTKADDVIGKLKITTTELGKAVLARGAVSVQLGIQENLGIFREKLEALANEFPELESAGDRGEFAPAISTLGRLTFLRKWEKECQNRLLDLIAIG